jgi:hypothetical protein
MIKQNDNEKYDYDLGLEQKQLDRLNPFHPMEEESSSILEHIINSKIEMKHHDSTMTTGNILIEFKIDKQGNGTYVPSGLSLSESDYYFLNIGVAGVFLPVNFLKWIGRRHKRFKLKIVPNRRQDTYIGKGFLIPFGQLPYLLAFYHQEELNKELTFGKN